jgi:uncharacterized protein YbjT (DUF2867 family)
VILVTGAGGGVGGHVVSQLLEAGAPVRAFDGDLTDPGTLAAALDGVEAVFLVWPRPDTAAAPAVLEAIAAQTPRVVYLSGMTAGDADIERLLHVVRLEWTCVRPGEISTWRDRVGARPLTEERELAGIAVHALTELAAIA